MIDYNNYTAYQAKQKADSTINEALRDVINEINLEAEKGKYSTIYYTNDENVIDILYKRGFGIKRYGISFIVIEW